MSEILRAEKLSMYFGGLKAVQNVDFTVQQGKIQGIIGPNGAGKTTFFNMCSGIYKPTIGRIFFDGEDITGQSPETICRKGLARTFQSTQLFKYMTVLENVKIGCHIGTHGNLFDSILHTKRYREDERYAQEHSAQIIHEAGLDQYMDQMAGNLAYGIQRRVEITRALATDPKLLLLDEPAAGMNPNETRQLMEFILTLKDRGYTILLIEHDMKFVMNCCDHIMVLNFGKKLCEGTPAQVRENREVQEAYFGSGVLMEEVRNDAEN